MDTLRLILLFVHVLGFAALIGGALAQAGPGPKRVNAAMRDGAGTAFVAGLEAGDADVDRAKIAVKLHVGLAVLGLVMANVKKEQVSQALWAGVLGLSVLNVAVAIFWSTAHV